MRHDGVRPDGTDNCIGSDLAATVVVNGCDSKAGNDLQANGCSVADDVAECAVKNADKPQQELACVAKETDRLRRAKIVTVQEQAGILVCTLLTLGH